jgi:hypothetical protein
MALGPIDYTLDVQNPLQSVMQGYQLGATIRNDQAQLQQQQASLQAQQRRGQLLAGLASKQNATADDYAAVMTQLPDLAEHLQKAWTTRNTAQQQSHATDLLQWGAAIKSGRPEVAERQINARADAMEASNGGQPTPESQALRTNAQVLRENPQFALGQIQAMLASNPAGKQAADVLATFGSEQRAQELQPSAVTKAGADASTAVSTAQKTAIDAKYAEQGAIKDLEKKGWDIKKIAADIDIAREANRIAAMNAATSRETNDLRRQELDIKVKEARNALDEKIRTRAAEAESAQSTTDNFLNTADRLLALAYDPKSKRATSTLRAAAGPLDSRLPTVQGDVADLEALVETLGSQAFLSQIPTMKGTGNLSEKEGDKLQAALTNLSLKQSPEQFLENVREAQRLVSKARSNISRRYGIPETPADRPARPGLPSGAAPAAPGASLLPPSDNGRPPLDSFFTPGT